MDTKQKRRPPAQPPRRPEDKKQAQKKRRPVESRTRREEPARRPAQQARRPAEGTKRTASNTRRPKYAPGSVRENIRPAESNAEEVVFRPAEQKQPKPRDPEAVKRAQMRKRSKQRAEERKKQEKRRKNRPNVVYTQPKPFNLNRLLLQLAVVLAVVLAITMGLSVFFKVDSVVVYGNKAYSAWTIQEAAGLEAGQNLLTFSRTRASGKIITALPYVKTARIGINLPDTVNIYIEEYDVAYAIQTADGTWWLMTSSGRMVEQIDGGTASNYTKVFGVEVDSPAEGEQAKAVEMVNLSTDSTDATDATDAAAETAAPVVTVTGADRLNAALRILTSLETNDIVGEVASVDVTSLTNLEMWYGQRYQVKLGDLNDMDKKISQMKQAVAQLGEYEVGILDVSFTTWTDRPGFTPSD